MSIFKFPKSKFFWLKKLINKINIEFFKVGKLQLITINGLKLTIKIIKKRIMIKKVFALNGFVF